MFACLLIALAAAPQVRIDGPPHSDLTRAQIAARLIEDGHRVLPASLEGNVRMRVEAYTSSVTIEVIGRRSVRATFGAGGAVEQLELLHFASNSVREVGEVISSTASVPSVAIRMLESSTIAEEARSAAILGLLDQGLAIVDLRRVHEIELCLRLRLSIAIWAVRGETCEERQGEALSVLSAPAPGRLERIRATVTSAVPRARPPPVALRPIDVATTSEVVDPLMIGLSIDAGATFAPVGPLVAIMMTLGGTTIQGAVELMLSSSRARDEGRIYELNAVVGPELRLAIDDGFQLRVLLLAGLLWHHFDLDRVGRGDRFDATVLGSVRAALTLVGPFAVELGLVGGASTRARAHRIEGEEVWRREPWMVALLAGFVWSESL